MGTTPNYDLPFPEGTDLVIAGDDAIEALAQATDDTIRLLKLELLEAVQDVRDALNAHIEATT